MLCESHRKAPNKIKKRKANFRLPLKTPISNHVYKKAILATICILSTVVIIGISIGAFDSSKAFVDASSVKGIGIGIYWNQDCTNTTFSVDWGSIQPGSNSTVTVYVRNEGSSAVSLWLGASNWAPSTALDYMSLGWNYSGQVLEVGQVIPLELTLTVDPTISGVTDFSFHIVITATEG